MKRRSQRQVKEDARLAQREAPVRAKMGMRHDLWFAEEGLYKVEVMRRRSLGFSVALPTIPTAVLLALAGPLGVGLRTPVVREWFAVLLASVGAAYLVPTAAVRRRRRLSDATLVQAKAAMGTQKISWDQVKRVALTRRTTVRLEIRRGRLTEVLRAGISRNDANCLKSIVIQSKGKSFEFRDGILR